MVKSTIEAKYITCSSAVFEAINLDRRFFYKFNKKITDRPIEIMYNNQATIYNIKNGVFGLRGNYIDHQYYYIFDMLKRMNFI